MHLFTYGTLMFPEVWRRIAVREAVSEPAVLKGFATYLVKDSIIPGMIRSSNGDRVQGVLYRDVDDEMLFELDAYESNFYSREVVRATTRDGESVECQAYVIADSQREMLSDQPWDADWFAEHELAAYLRGA